MAIWAVFFVLVQCLPLCLCCPHLEHLPYGANFTSVPLHGEACDPKVDTKQYPLDTYKPSKATFLYCDKEKRIFVTGNCTPKLVVLNSDAKAAGQSASRLELLRLLEQREPARIGTGLRVQVASTQGPVSSSSTTAAPTTGSTGTVTSTQNVWMDDVGVNALEEGTAFAEDDEQGGSDARLLIGIGSNDKLAQKETTHQTSATMRQAQTTTTPTTTTTTIPTTTTEQTGGSAVAETENDRNGRGRKANGSGAEIGSCADGLVPFAGNDGQVHRCFPDYGHNPYSGFACPFSYRCEFSPTLAHFQCCPRLVDSNNHNNLLVVAASSFDPEETSAQWLSAVCPSGFSPTLDARLSQPMVPCFPGWSAGCPALSKCLFSRQLNLFVCCQPNELSQRRPKAPKTLLPGQSGCSRHSQCAWHLLGVKCVRWVCKCPGGMVALDESCAFRCPVGQYNHEGVCTQMVAVEDPHYQQGMLWMH